MISVTAHHHHHLYNLDMHSVNRCINPGVLRLAAYGLRLTACGLRLAALRHYVKFQVSKNIICKKFSTAAYGLRHTVCGLRLADYGLRLAEFLHNFHVTQNSFP